MAKLKIATTDDAKQYFTTTAIGIVITLIGVPIYFYMQKKNAKAEH